MSLKIVHWTCYNESGMNAVAVTMSTAERAIGLDSYIANAWAEKHDDLLDRFLDADIHFSHTYLPDWFRKRITRPYKLAWIGHGTPEVVFNGAIHDGGDSSSVRHGVNDGLMLQQYYLSHADLIFTFWERHAAIYRTMVDKKTPVHLIPMGIDLDYWKPVPSRGKFAGDPSLFYCENTYEIKWPYDILIAWPWVYNNVLSDPSLHITRLSYDKHRWFFPLANRNGSAYACHISPIMWQADDLRNAYCSVDYQIGLVRYGDFNRVSLEANACGTKTISYRGNPYTDFWLDEGDQRTIASQLVAILKKETPPRKKLSVPSALETARQMKLVYESAC